MVPTNLGIRSLALIIGVLLSSAPTLAQEAPKDYEAVPATLGRKGDFKDGVLKVNVPRGDLTVTIKGRPAPTPFGFGGWVAFTRAADGSDVMMGDLVLADEEVNPVMSALLDNGLEVTALHNHFFQEQPRVFYLHVHGHGAAADLARRLTPAIALIDKAASTRTPVPAATTAAGTLDTGALARIVGHPGEQSGAVYKITIGRPDIDLREHGATINARMGLNTWAAFTGADADAMVAGDVAMLETEVTPVLKALRANGLEIVAIHHHMTGVQPMVVFLHYFATGPADRLARGVRAALDQLGKPAALRPQARQAGEKPPATVLFVCEHGVGRSAIAAAWFNRLAKEKGLPYEAQFRGTQPDPAIPPIVREGLTRDGFDVRAFTPAPVTPEDLRDAEHIVVFGCVLPGRSAVEQKVMDVNGTPGPGDGYEPSRDAIRAHVERLVEQLAKR